MKYKTQLILLALFGLLVSCNSHNQSENSTHAPNRMNPDLIQKYFDAENGCFRDGIVGGSPVTSQNPRKNHVALLLLTGKNGEKSICTGVLLSKRVLLTAAHCVDATQLDVYFHHSSYCSQGMNKNLIYRVEKAVFHPQWRNQHSQDFSTALQQANNDLALVKLEKDAPFSYQPIRIAEPQDLSLATEIFQIGYGRIGTNESQPPVLREVLKKNQQLKYLDYSHYFLMEQRNSQGGCSGDSGGPLMIKTNDSYRVLGIASFLVNYKSKDTACETGDLAYVSLGDYLSWINETLKQLN